MKIVMVTEELRIGGLPNYILMLTRMLTNVGHEIVVAHGNSSIPAHLEVDNIDLSHQPGLNKDATDEEVACSMDAIVALSPDIVHVHMCKNLAVIDRLLATRLHLVRTHHEYGSLCLRNGKRRWTGDRCQRPLGYACAAFGCFVSPSQVKSTRLPHLANLRAKVIERDRYRQFDANIVTSAHMRRSLAINQFPSHTCHTVPYFTRFEAEANDSITPVKPNGIPGRQRPLELLFAGQALKVKGLEVLIEALIGLAGDWHLTVLSEGPRLGAANVLAESAGLSSRITFLGWAGQSAMREFYRMADIFVLPSLWDEPFGLVGIEAMSFGTPVVGFDVGGIPDYLINKQTGLLVSRISAIGLRQALQTVLTNPQEIAVWGRSARKFVARRYSQQIHLKALSRVYEGALQHDMAMIP